MEVELETVGSTVVSDRRQNACASKLCQKIQYLARVLQIPTDTCEKPVGGYLTLTPGFMTLVNSKRTIIAASREITFDVKGTHHMSTRRCRHWHRHIFCLLQKILPAVAIEILITGQRNGTLAILEKQ